MAIEISMLDPIMMDALFFFVTRSQLNPLVQRYVVMKYQLSNRLILIFLFDLNEPVNLFVKMGHESNLLEAFQTFEENTYRNFL